MSQPSPNGNPDWKVEVSALIIQKLRQFSEIVGQWFALILRTVVQRLRTSPEEFGEPMYHLPVGSAEVRLAARAPLVVAYVVFRESRLVWIIKASLLSIPGSAN